MSGCCKRNKQSKVVVFDEERDGGRASVYSNNNMFKSYPQNGQLQTIGKHIYYYEKTDRNGNTDYSKIYSFSIPYFY